MSLEFMEVHDEDFAAINILEFLRSFHGEPQGLGDVVSVCSTLANAVDDCNDDGVKFSEVFAEVAKVLDKLSDSMKVWAEKTKNDPIYVPQYSDD